MGDRTLLSGARADLTLAAVLRAMLAALPILLAASFASSAPPLIIGLLAAALPFTAALLVLQRRGRCDLCAHAAVFGLIFLCVAVAALSGSVRSVGTAGLVAAITIAGVFLGRRALLAAVGISVGSIGALIYAENAGWLHPHDRSLTASHWVMYSVIIVAVAFVLSYLRSILSASEARFRHVFESSPVGMTVTRVSDGRYMEANRADQHNLGYTREELLGRTTLEMGAWSSNDDRQRFLAMLRAQRAVEGFETRMRHRSGELVDCRVWARFAEIDGEQCVLASTVNVTDQLRAERQLQRDLRDLNAVLEQRVRDRTEELETANRDLEGFSYSVSHDLRAPLRAITGFSARLRTTEAERLSEDGRGLLRRVEQGARRAAALIDALLEFSRLGRKPVAKVVVPMSRIVLEVLRELSAQPEAQRVEVRLGALPDCQGDPILLKQVWQNLIGNAFKYSRKRDRPVVEIGHEHAEYFVRDNGAGFDMEYASKLFGVFERLHSAAEFEGTGIGLATANRIVQRHGGAIRAEGATDRGATFRFRLPEAS